MKIKFTVPLIVPSLKNQKKLGHGRMFDDPEVKAFKRDFPTLVPAQYRTLGLGDRNNFLQITVNLFHKDWRRDADAAIILDCLQSSGVISNDRWCRKIFVDAVIVDPESPRAEIIIEELGYGAAKKRA